MTEPQASSVDMGMRSRVYVSAVIAGGATVAAFGIAQSVVEDSTRFLTFLLLALAGAAVKVRLPNISGTYSLHFVFVLAAMPILSLAEVAAIAAVGAIVQCFWRVVQKPTLPQFLFNLAGLAISAAAAHVTYHAVVESTLTGRADLAALTLSSTIYWVANTGLVAGILTLQQQGSLSRIWQLWFIWSLPYYVVGAVIAGGIDISVQQVGWRASLLFLPVIALFAAYYRTSFDSRGAR